LIDIFGLQLYRYFTSSLWQSNETLKSQVKYILAFLVQETSKVRRNTAPTSPTAPTAPAGNYRTGA